MNDLKKIALFMILALFFTIGCVNETDECNDFVLSAEKQLANEEFKGRYHYAIEDYEKAANCYSRAGNDMLAEDYWNKVIETYSLEGIRELNEGSLVSAGKCNFYMAYYSLVKLDDPMAAKEYALESVKYYEKINDTGFKYTCAKAIAENDTSYLEAVDAMIDLTGDETMRRTADDLKEKIQ